jgi:hypothetical protein
LAAGGEGTKSRDSCDGWDASIAANRVGELDPFPKTQWVLDQVDVCPVWILSDFVLRLLRQVHPDDPKHALLLRHDIGAVVSPILAPLSELDLVVSSVTGRHGGDGSLGKLHWSCWDEISSIFEELSDSSEFKGDLIDQGIFEFGKVCSRAIFQNRNIAGDGMIFGLADSARSLVGFLVLLVG